MVASSHQPVMDNPRTQEGVSYASRGPRCRAKKKPESVSYSEPARHRGRGNTRGRREQGGVLNSSLRPGSLLLSCPPSDPVHSSHRSVEFPPVSWASSRRLKHCQNTHLAGAALQLAGIPRVAHTGGMANTSASLDLSWAQDGGSTAVERAQSLPGARAGGGQHPSSPKTLPPYCMGRCRLAMRPRRHALRIDAAERVCKDDEDGAGTADAMAQTDKPGGGGRTGRLTVTGRLTWMEVKLGRGKLPRTRALEKNKHQVTEAGPDSQRAW